MQEQPMWLVQVALVGDEMCPLRETAAPPQRGVSDPVCSLH